MKILVISNMYPSKKYPFYGTFVKNFCMQLGEMGINYELSVMTKGKNKWSKMINYILFYSKTFIKVLCKKYDIIYIHYASHSSWSVLAASKIKNNLKIYTNVHGSDVVPENKKQEKFQKYTQLILNKSEKVVVASQYFKKYVIEKYKIDQDNISIYPSGGVDQNVFYKIDKKELDEFCKEYELEQDKKYIGFISRISQGKGWDTYCYSMKAIVKKYENIRGIIVGSGLEDNELNQLLETLELKEYIKVIPSLPQDKLNQAYNIIECLVFPSRRKGESLGLIPLEVMCVGTPVIVSDFAAPGEYIVDKINGLKFKVNDSEDLSKKIEEFLQMDILEKDKIIENARKTAEKYYVKNTKNILEGILNI